MLKNRKIKILGGLRERGENDHVTTSSVGSNQSNRILSSAIIKKKNFFAASYRLKHKPYNALTQLQSFPREEEKEGRIKTSYPVNSKAQINWKNVFFCSYENLHGLKNCVRNNKRNCFFKRRVFFEILGGKKSKKKKKYTNTLTFMVVVVLNSRN